LDSSLRVTKASSSFYKTFKVSPEETEKRYFFDLGNGHWNSPSLQTRLEEVAHTNTPLVDFPINQDFEKIGRRFMILNASRILSREKGEQLVLLAMVDITDQKKVEEDLAIK